MQIILSRHGNTFLPKDPVVWVGAKQDLPLVDSGIQQAKCLAQALKKSGIKLKAVYCGPLKRTRDYAAVVLKELHVSLKPIIDTRLNEIDYGNWSGLNNIQIKEIGEGAELSAWENFSVWPKIAGWSGSSTLMEKEVKGLAKDLLSCYDPTDTILLISSNGRLRYFLKLIPKAFAEYLERKQLKVATGNICLFVYSNKNWQIAFWNQKPDFLI